MHVEEDDLDPPHTTVSCVWKIKDINTSTCIYTQHNNYSYYYYFVIITVLVIFLLY